MLLLLGRCHFSFLLLDFSGEPCGPRDLQTSSLHEAWNKPPPSCIRHKLHFDGTTPCIHSHLLLHLIVFLKCAVSLTHTHTHIYCTETHIVFLVACRHHHYPPSECCQLDFPQCLAVTADNTSRYFANMPFIQQSSHAYISGCVCVSICVCVWTVLSLLAV